MSASLPDDSLTSLPWLADYGLVPRFELPRRTQAALLREQWTAGPSGLLVRPRDGVARWWQELAILVAQSWPDVAVSKAAAAVLYRLDSFEPGKVPPSVDLRRNRSVRGCGAHRPVRPPEALVVEGLPFPVVSPVQALLGIAGQMDLGMPWMTSLERLELAFESGLRNGLLTHGDLVEAIDGASRTHAGKTDLRRLLLLRPADLVPTESFLETRCVQVLRRFGIVELRRQVEIFDRDGFVGRVDFLFGRVVIECDGAAWHDNREAFHRDRERRSRLLALGHPVVEVTSRRLEHDAYGVVAAIRGASRLAA